MMMRKGKEEEEDIATREFKVKVYIERAIERETTGGKRADDENER